MARTLLIVGASGRAAAASAIRAGWQPVVIDLFADEDTRAFGPVSQCPLAEYPHGFIALAERAPPGPWMYTGGLENAPDVVAAISRNRKLLGVPPEVLELVRDPFRLAAILPMPAMRKPGEALDPEKRWLRKPLRGSGGFGIAPVTPEEWAATATDMEYAQELVEGNSYSAAFVIPPNGDPHFVGGCRQLIGDPKLKAPPYRYCGNVGPTWFWYEGDLELYAWKLQQCGLIGLIGFDFLYVELGRGFQCLEVNPRYTASVEVLELASGQSAVAKHLEAFGEEPGPYSAEFRGWPICKAIHYADKTFVVPDPSPWSGPRFADIPRSGLSILAGQPVVTEYIFGGDDGEAFRDELEKLLGDRWLI